MSAQHEHRYQLQSPARDIQMQEWQRMMNSWRLSTRTTQGLSPCHLAMGINLVDTSLAGEEEIIITGDEKGSMVHKMCS